MGSEKDPVLSVVTNHVLRKHGVFNFDAAFANLTDWLGKHGYDMLEKKRTEKDKGSDKYMEYSLGAERIVNEYVKYTMDIEIWLRDAKKVEGGKTAGRVEFIFSSKMHKNIEIRGEKKFAPDDNGTFMHFVKEIYEKYIARSTLEKLEEKLFNETMDFIESTRLALG